MILNHPAIALNTLAAERRLAAARADRFGPLAAVEPLPARSVPRRRLPVGRIAVEWLRIVTRTRPVAAESTR